MKKTIDFSHSREALGRAVARRREQIEQDGYENFVVPSPPMDAFRAAIRRLDISFYVDRQLSPERSFFARRPDEKGRPHRRKPVAE
jgi:hypothetical protein